MKTMKTYGKLLCLALLFVLCMLALAACGEDPNPTPPDDPCTHDWVAGEFTVRPVCGEVSEGKRTYTCSLCDETKEETVTNDATACEYDDGVVTLAPTCETDGKKTYTCTACGNTRDEELKSPGEHAYDYYSDKIEVDYDNNKRYIPCIYEGCGQTIEKEAYVTYRDYGAVGDGKTDDFKAIRDAHAYANEWGIDVWGTKGDTYYIGASTETAIIRTNVDWRNSVILIDDSDIRWNDTAKRSAQVFRVAPQTAAKNVTVPTGTRFTAGQTNIGMTFQEPCMLKIENSNEKIFIRYGINDGAANRHEFILVDENGNVDPTTPIQYDYTTVTSIKAYSVTDAPITIKNGRIRTVTCDPKIHDPNYVNNYCYFNRGIEISRSNTTIEGMRYVIDGEHVDTTYEYGSRGVPYNGTFLFHNAYNLTFRDSTLQTHKTYSFFDENKNRNEMGTYTINATGCININFINLIQSEYLTDTIWSHGIMGSNFCRNFYVEGCELDRFDAHQGLYNATIKDTTLGASCKVIGGGTLILENVTRLVGTEFIHLRRDYNSFFDGTIIIKNCVAESPIASVVGLGWNNWDSGLPNVSTRELHIDGLQLKTNGVVQLFLCDNVTEASLTSTLNPLILPEKVTVKGLVIIASDFVVSHNKVYKDHVVVERLK